MADSFNKKERNKKKQKRKKEKRERREQRKADGVKSAEFMYMDEFGNLSTTPPDPNKKREVALEEITIGVPKREKSDQSNFERTGVVKFFNTEKGYGFIIDSVSKDSYFAHSNNLVDDIRDNDKVVFEMGTGPKGPIAINVRLA